MNRSKKKFKVLMGMTALMLATSPAYSLVSAATAVSTPQITAVSKVIKPIYLNANSYINLVDVDLAPVDNGQIAAFTLSIYNGTNSILDLSDYWFRLANTSGSSYPIKTSAADAKTTKVAPKSKIFITLYATVGETTKLSDLVFKVVKFDFSVAGYEKGIGRIGFPANYTNTVGLGSYKALYYATTVLNSKVSSASIASSGDDQLITVNFVYNNVGKKAVTLSKYKYYLVSSGGLMYQATSSEGDDLVMDPLKRTEFQLTATVPAALKKTGWKLMVLRDNGADSTISLPVGSYQLNLSSGTTSTTSDSFTYSNTAGKYQFNLTQLLRAPWESQDILTGRIRITNKSTTSVAIPAISGYFYLDDTVKLDFKAVAVNNQFGLNSNGYIDLDVYAKIPSNYSFTKAQLVINNKVDDKTTTKWGVLTSTSFLSSIPSYAVDKAYQISRDGSKMTGSLNNVNVYNSTTTKVFSVQMTLTSDEQRTINPVKLVGIFKNDNGDLFPATATMPAGQVNPLNKALVTFTANVPQNYDTSNLKLIVGEGVTDTTYSDAASKADGFVNAVAYSLPQEQRLYNNFKEISFLPYKFTINKILPTQLGDDIQLTLNYNLDKDTSYNVYPTDRKLVLEVDGITSDGATTYNYFTQELTIEGDTATALKAGTSQEMVIKKANPYSSVDGTLKYKLRLYEVVSGSKKLVAERSIDNWYYNNDWTADTSNAQ